MPFPNPYLEKLQAASSIDCLMTSIDVVCPPVFYGEISIQKRLSKGYCWTLEYSAGFPFKKIAENTYNCIPLIFEKFLFKYLEALSLEKAIQSLTQIRDRCLIKYHQFNNPILNGGIIVNGRSVSRRMRRAGNFRLVSGSFQQKSTEVINSCQLKFGMIRPELAPDKVIADLWWHKSARIELFQELIEICNRSQQKLIERLVSEKQGPYCFNGHLTDIVAIGIMIYNAGLLQSAENNRRDLVKFLNEFLSYFNCVDKNIHRTIDNLFSSDFFERVEKKFLKWLHAGFEQLEQKRKPQ